MELLLVLLIPLYAVFNRFRGTKGWGGPAGGALTCAIIFAYSGNMFGAVAAGGLYISGEAMGWGRWLATVPMWGKVSQQEYWDKHRQPTRGKFIHNIANKIAREDKDYVDYAKVALIIRGLYWWVPIAIATTVTGISNPAAAVCAGALGATMPGCYRIAYKKWGEKEYWKRGEQIYGAVHGVIIALLLI